MGAPVDQVPQDGQGEHQQVLQLWPVFICYRQVDGLPAARRLHELLDKRQVTGPNSEQVQFDVYLDQTMPAVADWREIHKPYLERARALLVVCTPGAKLVEGPDDWVHKEITWWLEHRPTAPILIDPLRQGLRYVPTAIRDKWLEIQRIPLVEAEWKDLPAAALAEKAAALRRQIIGSILPSGAAIYAAELEAERQRTEGLRSALQGRTRALQGLGFAFAAAIVLLIVAAGTAKYAFDKRAEADESRRVADRSAEAEKISRRISEATLLDAQAAASFDEARRFDARWNTEQQRQIEIKRALGAATADNTDIAALRKQNLAHELRQVEEEMKKLAARAVPPRNQGYQRLKAADEAWNALAREGQAEPVQARTRPVGPEIFSVELISAGSGESILIHYGTPDATRLVMINGSTGRQFEDSVGRRLRALKAQRRFADAPVPIELFIASDQDEHKIGGLLRLLRDHVVGVEATSRLADIRAIWANLFASSGLRGELRRLLAKSEIPLNTPFDHLVMRPEKGQVVHRLPDGLEVIVIGPDRKNLEALYDRERRVRESGEADPRAPIIDSFPEERFSRLTFAQPETRLAAPPPVASDRCTPSLNAQSRGRVELADRSLPNLASTILLFRYRGKTFLHTGDSRADLIEAGLLSSGLIEGDKNAHVDLLHLPHLGSNRNLTAEFLERVTAGSYLFSGDGTFANPSIETIGALIAMRPCAEYTMYFINRDSTITNRDSVPHSERLDRFFAAEEQYEPRYRRIFRATDQGSVIIDLLDPLTY